MNIGVEEIGVEEFSEIVTWTGLIELRTHCFYLYKFQIRVFGKFQHMPENSKVPMIENVSKSINSLQWTKFENL